MLVNKELKIQKKTVILMHGKDTNPQEKWYPWLAKKMAKMNINFIAPALPQADDPEIEAWLSELNQINIDEKSILVGHSRGGVAILRWLERQPESLKVKKVILVATNSGDSTKRNKTENNRQFFSKNGYNFAEIKKHCDDFVVLHSKDDQWVPFSAAVGNARALNAKFLKFENRGHFGWNLQKQEIPELLKEILRDNFNNAI